jgi:hypothetical protein
MMESRGVNEAAKCGDSKSRCRAEKPKAAVVSSNQLVLKTEGAEPGSTSVDGSYQALSPVKVRYIIRTLLT